MASGERFFQALDWDEKYMNPNPIILPKRLRGEVTFNKVNFPYDEDTPVLKDVSFNIPQVRS